MSELQLGFGIAFDELYEHTGLSKLDTVFVEQLKTEETELYNRLMAARHDPETIEDKDESELLIALAPHLEDFIAKLFGVEKEVRALAGTHHELADLYTCKRLFIRRRLAKICKEEEAKTLDGEALAKELEALMGEPLSELSFSKHVVSWLDNEEHEDKINIAGRYASWALYADAGKAKHPESILFSLPHKLDFEHLVPVETEERDGMRVMRSPDDHIRYRDGFKLTDPGGDLKIALDDANYCIFCHNQGKDSCSKGLKEKPDPETGKAEYKKTVFGVTQAGCPLEEKISEMNTLKADGVPVGALAVVTVDNPLCAATGHRICNDCMKSCIYQKQEPVNIPRTETRTLQDILDLPWGFEIYGLLTRWNPLNIRRPFTKPDTGYKVLVAGLGPAGFSLAHHLINDGHTVVAVDGLKIEPLPEEISGVTALGERVPFAPIKDIQSIFESLDERVQAGFGGVAEYGITVRWNKNYLKIIRLLIERRQQFSMFGGIRFGGTLTYEKAFELGFDHVALALGAGRPTLVGIPNALSRGVRTASDFLMALQVTGAAKEDSVANLQLRLPVAVIGGGLTAVDTATESLAYYPIQVEKFLSRYEVLVKEHGEAFVRASWTEEDAEIAEEFITHAEAIREEKVKAEKEGRDPDVLSLIRGWGGVHVVYRRRLIDAPSYRLNHEEVEKALEEGIEFIENVSPAGIRVDEHGHAIALRVNSTNVEDPAAMMAEEKIIPAKSIFMAAGTNPNTVLQREDPEHFELDGNYFAAIDEHGHRVTPEPNLSKPEQVHILASKNEQDKYVSYFGDLHPSFVGNVVKAMGSVKQGYPIISKVLAKTAPASDTSSKAFLDDMTEQLTAKVHDVIRLTPTIVEVIIKAPLAARGFLPGQFYRLQNFEQFAMKTENGTKTTLGMEGLALTGAWVDKEQGLLSTIVLEMGGSSDLCAYLQKDEPVILMGPTGTPTETPGGETVMLVGGGLGNAVLFSIGKAFREAGSKVLYFAGYKKMEDRYKVAEIEAAADVVVWCCDEGEFEVSREGDKTLHGNIVQAIQSYAKGELGDKPIATEDVDRIIAIGSDRMMAAVTQARHSILKDYLKEDHIAIGSINSPMQCMMKEICAQCLQKHVDPETGERHYVYSCFNQDQCLDKVNFAHLNERLGQNALQEKLTRLWIDRSLKHIGVRTEAA